jgi:sialate O-acetylesterase
MKIRKSLQNECISKKSNTYRALLIILLFFSLKTFAQEKIKLPALISNYMVLQQKTSVKLWGTSIPGSKIVITASWGKTSKAIANHDSSWAAYIKTPAAGGPYTITFSTTNFKKVLTDILIGEVWLCSGQSNMEMPLAGWPPAEPVLNSQKEIEEADFPSIRLFSETTVASLTPETQCRGAWEKCSPQTAGSFSAIGYFFGKKLFSELKIPIGLINATWGGTPAEAWTGEKWLSALPDFTDTINVIQKNRPSFLKLEEWLSQFKSVNVSDYNKNDLWNKIEIGDSLFALTEYNDSDWNMMNLPVTFDKSDLGEFKGFIWFRKKIDLPDDWIGKNLKIELGPIDDYDRTFVNGKFIGATETYISWKTNRVYTIPAEVNRTKELLIAVRINNTGGEGGGIYGEKNKMQLFANDSLKGISLSGKWKYLPAAELHKMKYYVYSNQQEKLKDRPKISFPLIQQTPTALYNGMIFPLRSFTIKGVIWYQGESNTVKPIQYEKLFPVLIENWREDWGCNFPFYYVQTAPYKYWKGAQAQLLRDAQRKSLTVPNTGMVVTLDVGDFNTVHPPYKSVVGERLAFWALAKQYGKNISYSGPLYKSYKVVGRKMELCFDYRESGLKLANTDSSTQFLVAGEDKIFKPAMVKVENDKLYVWSDEIETPVAVRYCWDNYVIPTLFNNEGLPASSFRTDNW